MERLWRTVKYEEVYLKAYADVPRSPGGNWGDYFRFYNDLRPHQALGYRTPAEVFHGERGAGKRNLAKGGVHRGPGQYYWQESRGSHLTRP